MRFVVGDTVKSDYRNEALPPTLRNVPFPPNKQGLDHSFEFQRQGSQWKINGITWADGPEARVMAKPKRGAVERWSLKNGSGGWVRRSALPHTVFSMLIISYRLTPFTFTSSTSRSYLELVPVASGRTRRRP